MDLKAMADLWDTSDPHPFYLPEEVEQPLRDWDAIRAYWDKAMAMIPRLKMRLWDLHAAPLSDAEGWRFCRYAEAPLAPILYMRKLYENSVDPNFS